MKLLHDFIFHILKYTENNNKHFFEKKNPLKNSFYKKYNHVSNNCLLIIGTIA